MKSTHSFKLILILIWISILSPLSFLNHHPLLAADQQNTATPQLKLQDTCPILGEKIDKQFYVDALGQRIYVCCRGCLSAVQSDPEQALNKLHDLGEYAESIQSLCPVMGNDIDPKLYVEYIGRRIYVCCKNCLLSVKKDPMKFANLIADEKPIAGHHDNSNELDRIPSSETIHEDNDHGDSSIAHDHARDHGTGVTAHKFWYESSIVQFMGRFHPVLVHFPIALAIISVLAEILFILFKSPFFSNAARFSILSAAFFTIPAVLMGWATGLNATYPEIYGDTGLMLLSLHKWIGTIASVFIIISSFFSEVAWRTKKASWTWVYRISLVISVSLVSLAGHFAGLMIYGQDHFSWPT